MLSRSPKPEARTAKTHYVISWSNANDHLFDISLRFTAPADDPLLWLPAWRPGRYLIQNYAANVRECNATKIAKSEWRVSARAGEEVVVTYRFYAGVLDAGSSFLDEEEAYVNPSNLLMCVEALRGEPATLTIAAPVEWTIETQLPREDDAFRARDYDHLIDSPIIAAASLTRHAFTVPRVPRSSSGSSGESSPRNRGTEEPEEPKTSRIHVVVRGEKDFEPYLESLRTIVHAQAALFGGLPFHDYRFLVHVGDRWHGVEHEESSSIVVKRFDPDDHFLSFASHELFHAWNVKRIVPAAFLPYDYLHETPTRLLWAVEGMTSYYGDLMLARAGVWDEARYLDHLRDTIEQVENAPGARHLSVAQASFDAWLQEPAQMHDKSNAWVSFYAKGEVVSALLDLAIRSAADRSLDDVVRLLWREYGQTGRGLPEDGVRRAVAEIAGEELARDFFARYVDGTEPLPYQELFSHAAVAFDSAAAEANALGAKLREAGGRLMIESVTRGGSAMEAGLLPGDELIAIDGARASTAARVERIFAELTEGEAVDVVFARGELMRSRPLVVRRDPRVSITLAIDGESALRNDWLRRIE